jgi:hypothetical protein
LIRLGRREQRIPLFLWVVEAHLRKSCPGASALAPEKVAVIEEQVRRRVLRWFSRHGLVDPDDACDRLAWDNGGFSLDASVCIAGQDRAERSGGCATVRARGSPSALPGIAASR